MKGDPEIINHLMDMLYRKGLPSSQSADFLSEFMLFPPFNTYAQIDRHWMVETEFTDWQQNCRILWFPSRCVASSSPSFWTDSSFVFCPVYIFSESRHPFSGIISSLLHYSMCSMWMLGSVHKIHRLWIHFLLCSIFISRKPGNM